MHDNQPPTPNGPPPLGRQPGVRPAASGRTTVRRAVAGSAAAVPAGSLRAGPVRRAGSRPSWFVQAPPGARYDHLARNPLNAWWRQVVGTLLVALAFFGMAVFVVVAGAIVAAIADIPAPMTQEQLFGDPVFSLTVTLLSIAAVLPLVYGTVAVIQRRRPGTLSSVMGRLRWRWLMECVGIVVVALVLGQAARGRPMWRPARNTSELLGWKGWSGFLPALVVIVLLVPFQAAARSTSSAAGSCRPSAPTSARRGPGIVLGSAGFAALHAYTDWGILDVFSFGVLMGWLAVRTGGLEAPIAMHVVNNTLAFAISAAAGDLDDALRQGAVPWQSLAGTVVQLSVFALGVLWLARKRAIATVSG
ncbi:CPBP family intramembrane glutamic endopeptidase [Nonomuraea dietziae]|uniref:CPBP family intramembrane glutamic endopeptidase n=1 Tax=Nonomuraea dietziae TaxID=65515 RepID=UPI0031D23FA2